MGCAEPGAGLAIEGPGDDPRDRVLAPEQVARLLTRLIELRQGNCGLVGRDLKDAIRGGVDNPATASAVLLSIPVQDRSARARQVAQHTPPGGPLKFLNQLRRESLRIGRKWALEDDSADLPVARGAVFPRTGRLADAGRRRWIGDLGQAVHRGTPPESQPLQLGQAQPSYNSRDVAQSVAAGVSVCGRIVGWTDTKAVQDDDGRPPHQGL